MPPGLGAMTGGLSGENAVNDQCTSRILIKSQR